MSVCCLRHLSLMSHLVGESERWWYNIKSASFVANGSKIKCQLSSNVPSLPHPPLRDLYGTWEEAALEQIDPDMDLV